MVASARMNWTVEEFGTGVELVDSQHKELFTRINQTLDKIDAGVKPEDMKAMLKFLGEYVVNHFSCEEKLMTDRKCMAECPNKDAHAQFLKSYASLNAMFEKEGLSPTFVTTFKSMMFVWLTSHIKILDSTLRHTQA